MKMNVLTDVSKMTRNDVVPFYESLIASHASDSEVVRVNSLILSKWSNAGLTYIKEKAWKSLANRLQKVQLN